MWASRRHVVVLGMIGGVMLVSAAGCNPFSAAMQGGKMGGRLLKGGPHVRVILDGHEAKESKLKKAVVGHSKWKISQDVGTSPTLRFRVEDPEEFGRITMTALSFFEKSGDRAIFTVIPIDNQPEHLLKPNTGYNMMNLPGHLLVTDSRGNKVERVKLLPDTKYRLQLTIKADKSEAAEVYFKTK